MKTNSENGGNGGGGGVGGWTSSETVLTNHGGVTEVGGATKSMRIIQEEEQNECNSFSSSSIGDNSDSDSEGDAQSGYRHDHHNNNGSFDDAIHALEEALPIRRGISTFYNGKSKSFTSLSDVWPSPTCSIQEIAKPENAYTRKRRNLLASTLSSSKNKLLNINTGRITKKPKPTTTMLRFTLERQDPKLDTQTQATQNNLTSLRSFSMVNLCQCSSTFGFKSAKVGNC